jgi:tetratricopeptide (TPR) repeat protein
MSKRTVLKLLACLLGLTVALVWLWPHDAEYYFNRGRERFAYQDEDGHDDMDRALADFNRAIKLNPEFAAAFGYRGRVRGTKGDPGGALADYDRAIELDPKEPEHYLSRAWFWEAKDDFDHAIADLDRAIELDPKKERFFTHRAILKRKKGDLSGTVADMARASEVVPPAPAEQLRLADALRFAGDSARVLRGSLRNYDRAIEHNPNFSWGYYHRGVLKHLAGDLDAALTDFRRSSEFPDFRLKDYAAIHIWLVRADQGELAEANRDLSTYLSTRANGSPRDWEVRIARFLLGQISEAEFSAAVGVSDPERERSQFWYYAAEKQLLAGDTVKAAESFRQSRFTETRPYEVAISAQIELSRLDP